MANNLLSLKQIACIDGALECSGRLYRYGKDFWSGPSADVDATGKPLGMCFHHNTVKSLIKCGIFEPNYSLDDKRKASPTYLVVYINRQILDTMLSRILGD